MKPTNSRAAGAHIIGRVAATSQDTVEVSAQIGTACATCSAKCGGQQVSRNAIVKARYGDPLKSGQTVILTAEGGALAQISLSLYLLPAIGFLAGAFVALSFALGDGWQALFGSTGLAAGLLIARRLLSRRYTAGTPLCAVQLTDK